MRHQDYTRAPLVVVSGEIGEIQQTFTCSNSTIETLKEGVRYVQS